MSYLDSLFSLSGKTAVVTGGTGVLGGEMAKTLAKAGAHAVLVGRSAKKGAEVRAAIEADGGSAEVVTADVTERAGIEKVAAHLGEAGRAVDILVNAAGVNAATPFFEIPDEEWERIFRVNLGATMAACQIFAKGMIDRGEGGAIINIASMSAITPLSKVFTYSASKAALLNLTQNLAREFAPHRVRVNALSPGFFPAEQNRKILTPERTASIMGHTPMSRFGESHELAGATLLLASDAAGSFITGHNLVVDGGFSAMTI